MAQRQRVEKKEFSRRRTEWRQEVHDGLRERAPRRPRVLCWKTNQDSPNVDASLVAALRAKLHCAGGELEVPVHFEWRPEELLMLATRSRLYPGVTQQQQVRVRPFGVYCVQTTQAVVWALGPAEKCGRAVSVGGWTLEPVGKPANLPADWCDSGSVVVSENSLWKTLMHDEMAPP